MIDTAIVSNNCGQHEFFQAEMLYDDRAGKIRQMKKMYYLNMTSWSQMTSS